MPVKTPEQFVKQLGKWPQFLGTEFAKKLRGTGKRAARRARRQRGGTRSFQSITGKLRKSINAIRVTRKRGLIKGGVTATAFYAHFLEFGTSRMAPRPFIRPAVQAEVGQLERELVEAVQKSAKRVGIGG